MENTLPDDVLISLLLGIGTYLISMMMKKGDSQFLLRVGSLLFSSGGIARAMGLI